jgi:chemotaxis-related protein WspD
MKSSNMPNASVQPCWSRIGVAGDRSCPELVEHVHCRNCPVYARGASQLLERELSADERTVWTRHYAQQKQNVSHEAHSSLVVFRVGVEWLGLPTRVVDEVIPALAIHSLPHRPSRVLLGVVNVRGELVPCVSLLGALGAQPSHAEEKGQGLSKSPRMLVLGALERRFVAPVAEVHGIRRFASAELVTAPATLHKAALAFSHNLLPWGERAVGCLSPDLLFAALNRSLT